MSPQAAPAMALLLYTVGVCLAVEEPCFIGDPGVLIEGLQELNRDRSMARWQLS